ncbi:MAG: hypothetical protein IJE59_00250 [Clostridia bacterium]|nr:hypothetical protein [Clostridia bacterium]
MKNRQQKRHPTHPAVPLLQPSGEKVSIKNKSGKPDVKGPKLKGKSRT